MNSVLARLGEERIRSICLGHNLQDRDISIVIAILDAWENLVGQPLRKMEVAIEKTRNNPRKDSIASSMLDISFEFAGRRSN